MNNDQLSYTHIFAWVGLFHLLSTSSRDDFNDDLEAIRDMLAVICKAAQAYNGNNRQILNGSKEILESIPTLISFCPDLIERIERV